MANQRRPDSAASFVQPLRGRDDEPTASADAADEPLDAAIARVLAELGGAADASINVYAIRPGSRAGEFVDSFPADAFAGEASFLKRIRDEFGPGEYRIQLRDGTKFLVNRLVRIAPARERARAEPEGITALGAVLAEHAKRTEELLRQMLAARAHESDQALLNRFKLMREVFAPAGARGGGGADAIAVFLQGLSLGRSLEPQSGAGTSDVLLETVRTFGPELVRAVRLQGAAAKPPAKPGPGAIARAEPGAAAGGPQVTPQVKKLLATLIEAAARDADPELYAALVLDQVGLEDVRRLFAAGDPVALLASFDPRVAQHAEWFAELRAALEASLEDPDTADGTAAGPGGGDADPEDHARHDA